MLAPWTSVPLTAIIGMKRGNKAVQKEVRKVLSPLLRKRSTSAATKLGVAQISGTAYPRAKEASMARRTGLPKSVLGLVAGVVLLVVLGFSASAASSRNQALLGTKAFHATKDCSGFTGLVGAYCTIRSTNVKALKVGSKIFYFQVASKTALNSDTVIYVERGSVATGHCLLHFATGVGLCTISDGTGTLAGFHLRVRVTADASTPELWHWDGTYSFNRG
jgi:hypothetical protein